MHRNQVEIACFTHKMSTPRLGDDDTLTDATKPLSKILYRFLHKDTEGEILEKKESPEPINVLPDDGAIGLTDQTFLEVLTTKTKRGKSNAARDEVFDTSRLGIRTVLKIYSTYLINALRDVVKYFPGLSLRTEPVTIPEPYCALIHYMTELEAYKTAHPMTHTKQYIEVCNEHIDILLGFLDRTFGKSLRLERERHQRQPPVATFKYLWLLFKPGQDVYISDKGGADFRPMVVADVLDKSSSWYNLCGWYVKYQSGSVEPVQHAISIPIFDGEKEITSLPAFPRHFHPRNSALEIQLTERGKKYLSLCEPSYKEYAGMTISRPVFNVRNPIAHSEKA
jgi:hypothetical protein